ncbi:MAG: acyl carrier protein [Propionibacteriaceae bacterium]|nr:acyl carrier protein [Propionibacteriaceae bacterium]
MLETVTDVIRDYKSDPSLVVTPETPFSSFGLDSLEEVELIMKVESVTGISVEMDGEILTVADLLALLEKAA